MKNLVLILPLVASLSSCAPCPSYPKPYTAAQLAADPKPECALNAYLTQVDASPDVCDLTARGPHVPAVNDKVYEYFNSAMRNGDVDPKLWRRCMDNLLRHMTPDQSTSLMDACAHSYHDILRNSAVEKDANLQKRLAELHQLYLDRPPTVNAHQNVMDDLAKQLHDAIDHKRIGPIATRYGQDVLDTVELQSGTWHGAPIDVAALDALVAANDEPMLRRIANRLPDPGLREQATRRVIRMHIAASPYDEVKADAANVENVVFQTGINKIDGATHAPTHAEIDVSKVPLRGILVQQDVLNQIITMVALGSDGKQAVLPEVDLRGGLMVNVNGIKNKVTLCAPLTSLESPLDPSPCIDGAEMHVDNAAAFLDQDGLFHVRDRMASGDALDLAKAGGLFLIPVKWAGKELVDMQWSLVFAKPEDLAFGPPSSAGAAGPPLSVQVDHHTPARYVIQVQSGDKRYVAFVEKADAANFHISTSAAAGAAGSSGRPGTPGAPGSDGAPAMCPSTRAHDGNPGGRGGDGGPGTDGGRGGDAADVPVAFSCAGPACDDQSVVQAMIKTTAGAGGAAGKGGAGGAGGAGGRGGAAATCTGGATLPAGNPGARGPDGNPGQNANAGAAGAAGNIVISIAN